METIALYFFIWSAAVIIVLALTPLLKIRAITNFFKVFFSWIPVAELIKLSQKQNYWLTFLLVLVALLLGVLLTSFFF